MRVDNISYLGALLFYICKAFQNPIYTNSQYHVIGQLPSYRSSQSYSKSRYGTYTPSHNYRTTTHLKMSDKDDNPYYKGMDVYQVLEIPKSADKKEVKSAFRKMVAMWHPDKFPDDEAKQIEGGKRMEKINRAYYILSDDDRRRRYDQFGEAGVGTSATSEEQIKAGGGPGFGGMGGQDVGDLSDVFDAFFGGGRGGGQRQQQRNPNAPVAGDDLQVAVEIPFLTAVFGGQEKVRVRRMESCGTCTGTGIKPGAKVKTCGVCGGRGAVTNMQRTPFGVFSNVQTCANCRGSGQEVEEYCPTCKGKGAVAESKEVVMKIPAGVESGNSLRIREAGNSGLKGGPRGDLFVELRVRKDPKFRRENTEIYTEEEISYTDAILGCTIKADSVDGKTEIKVPAGTQPEQKLRLKGKGVPRMGTEVRGDQFVTVKIKIPTNVSGKEKELIEQIAELSKKKGGSGFFNFGGNE